MRMWMAVLSVCLMSLAGTARAKESKAEFKTVEAKHFKEAEGVELSPAFSDYFYAELRNELTKAKLASEIVGEGEAVDDADAATSGVISGTITEYKKGSVVKSALIGFGAGLRSLKMDADVVRRSDSENLCVLHVHIRIDPRWNEKIMAKAAARQMVNEMKKALKERKAA
jgi:Domain of unknown function (DUF4410)